MLKNVRKNLRIEGSEELIFNARAILAFALVAAALMVAGVLYFFGILAAIIMIAAFLPAAYMITGLVLRRIDRTLRSQRLFISNVSHELRGPMAAMFTESEIAMQHLHNDQQPTALQARNLVDAIRRDLDGLKDMSNILKNLSLLTSLEYAKERPEFSKLDLAEVVERVSRAIAKQYADNKHIVIETRNDTEPIFVMGNESQIRQMITNLLKNAVAYSPRGSIVSAFTSQDANGGSVVIEDRGMGIAEKDLPFVLDPYFRAANHSGDKKEGGSGLGLAIVAALAKQHMAKIFIESELHKGTKVRLQFPPHVLKT